MNGKLFSPVNIGKVRLDNRTVMAPIVVNLADEVWGRREAAGGASEEETRRWL